MPNAVIPITVPLSPDTLAKVDKAWKAAGANSRTSFMREAVLEKVEQILSETLNAKSTSS